MEEQTAKNVTVDSIQMGLIFPSIRDVLNNVASESIHYETVVDRDVLENKFKLKTKNNKKPEVILERNTAVELGHPSVLSQSMIVLTEDKTQLSDNRISVYGKELSHLGKDKKHSFVQIIFIGLENGARPDPFSMEAAQYLMHRLPGYMVRSVPGKLWARISKQSLENGLDFQVIGSSLISIFKNEFEGIASVEIVFVNSDAIDTKKIKTIAEEVEILAGRHKKLALGINGDLECEELDCETCEEQEVCDNLREILKSRKNDDGSDE